ncbi:heme exporter protein CcmB [Pleionea litopenaei]|uniref:Heme exporter protein B n=1 Tax=Pleionea litopenaei TaxID=3070815 RepID=A0AA51RV28_9GAMM|nr:heme exporter protein CcmB [Pleionea sp. HL-JVS1]WMS88156.1 heme exporter protein CcmB [Pleionea sp. HL-JVS1]
MIRVLLSREIRLLARRKSELLNPLFFFLIVAVLFPFGVSPEPAILAELAPGVIWVCALLSILLSLDALYREDFDDGSMVQMLLSGASATAIVSVKALTNWLFTALPLIMMSPLIGMMLNLDSSAYVAMIVSLLLGTPAMCLIAAIGMSLTVGLRRGGILLALLVLPLYIPVLIFGAMAVNAAAMGHDFTGQLLFLGAFSVLTLSLAPWAAGAALRISLGE